MKFFKYSLSLNICLCAHSTSYKRKIGPTASQATGRNPLEMDSLVWRCLIYFTCHDISALPSANRRSLLHRGPTWRGMSANVTRLCVFVRVINFLYALRTSRNNAKFLIDTCQWGFFPPFSPAKLCDDGIDVCACPVNAGRLPTRF